MRLIQLNLWQGRLLQPAIRFLQEEQPDIICLQEVHSSQLDQPMFSFFSSLEAVRAAFPDYHGYYSPVNGFPVAGTLVQTGNAILTRFPIKQARTVFVNGQYSSRQQAQDFTPGANLRNLQVVRLDVNGKSLTVANHHGYWENDPLGSETTRAKLQLVASELAKEQEPIILAGDLNVTYESPHMEPLQTMLYDLIGEHKVKTTLSILSSVTRDVPCDHIMVSDNLRARKLIVCDDVLASDHLPLILEFDL
jgi:endonuclease/exonuclease/phosphatase family metal-dependent hydrolase